MLLEDGRGESNIQGQQDITREGEEQVVIDIDQWQLLERLRLMVDRAVKLECDQCHKLIPTVQFYDHLQAVDEEGQPTCGNHNLFRQSIQNLVNNDMGARSVLDGDVSEDVPTTNFTRANSVSASRRGSQDASCTHLQSRTDDDLRQKYLGALRHIQTLQRQLSESSSLSHELQERLESQQKQLSNIPDQGQTQAILQLRDEKQ